MIYALSSWLILASILVFVILIGLLFRAKRNSQQSHLKLKSELAAQESEIQLKAIFDQAAVGVAIIDSYSGKFQKVNQKYCDIIGYSAEEMLTLDFMKITHPDDLQPDLDNMQLLIKGEIRDFYMEKRLLKKDGTVVWINLAVSPLWKSGENANFHVAVVEDITERKLAEMELKKHKEHLEELVEQRTSELSTTNATLKVERDRIQGYFDLAETIVVTINTKGHITMLNRYGCKLLEYAHDELIGKNWFNTCLPQPEGMEVVYPAFKNLIGGDLFLTEYYENEIITRSGKRRLIVWHNNYLTDKNGNIEGTISTGEDITERKAVEEELKKAKEEAESANHSKSIFLANMSHELRTPLNVILGYAYILQTDPTIYSAQKEKIRTIERSGQHLLEQIADILDVAKIEANKIILYPVEVNIRDYINYICNYFTSSADSKGINLICSVDEEVNSFVRVDERRLQQIILNLVGNAIKFTEKGKVILKVESCELMAPISESECCLRISVEDTGIGIEKENLEKVFQPFVQIVQKSNKTEGTGLGLNIAQQLVKIMGSNIYLESEVSKGSRFWFDLILPTAEAIKDAGVTWKEILIGYQGKKRKLLVVDDVKDSREMMNDLLVSLGFEVIVAANGLDSVILAKDMQPDLILMDILMPGMNGYESLTTLHNVPECKNIPVVAMSASVGEESPALTAGFDSFISKPVILENLTSVLGETLRLEWIYKPDNSRVNEMSLVPPPDSDLKELRELAELGKMKRIVEWADETQAKTSEYDGFALHVKKLATAVQDKQLSALIEHYLNNKV